MPKRKHDGGQVGIWDPSFGGVQTMPKRGRYGLAIRPRSMPDHPMVTGGAGLKKRKATGYAAFVKKHYNHKHSFGENAKRLSSKWHKQKGTGFFGDLWDKAKERFSHPIDTLIGDAKKLPSQAKEAKNAYDSAVASGGPVGKFLMPPSLASAGFDLGKRVVSGGRIRKRARR